MRGQVFELPKRTTLSFNVRLKFHPGPPAPLRGPPDQTLTLRNLEIHGLNYTCLARNELAPKA